MADAPNQNQAETSSPLAQTGSPSPTVAQSTANELCKSRRIRLTQAQVTGILETAMRIDDQHILTELRTELQRSCIIVRDRDLETRPPDAALKARVDSLEAETKALALKVADYRKRAYAQLKSKISERLEREVAPFLKPVQTERAPKETLLTSHVGRSTARLQEVRSEMQRMSEDVLQTDRRVTNLRTVLQKIGEDAAGNLDADVSQTIDADWTLLMKDTRSKRGKRSRQESPIPVRFRRREEQSGDGMVSPFVTPRSKMRKRAARYCSDLPPKRLEMPR